MNELFALRLRKLRRERNESQDYLASLLNVTRATISGYERNIFMPTFDSLCSLARHYNVSIGYLSGTSDTRTAETNSQVRNEIESYVADFSEQELEELYRYAQFIKDKR